MKFTIPWLKEHLATEATTDEIAAKLTALGLEVEDIADRTAALGAFSVAYVRAASQHPDADRLRVCEVETKDGVKQIVCGAPNARAGLYGIYAPEGSVIPANGMVLKPSRIRGVESQGMLCSARELEIGEDHDGIIELSGEPAVGTPAIDALGIEGPVIEIALTPDRADCFGIAGIARDLAAAGLGELKSRDFTPVPAVGAPGPKIAMDFPDGAADACPLFAGRLIRNVKNGESPAWMQERLKAVGLRPISALVDITNYVMLDLNRPLHVFDAGKLEGDLTLRFARPGETMEALDERTYELDDGMTVIADKSGPQALGGIMGGAATGVDETTTDVLLEVALFDPIRTAMTGRRLGIESDARTRFERGLDPALVLPAVEHATRLILELCGGEPAGTVVVGEVPPALPAIAFRSSELARLGGIALEEDEIRRHLEALGFGVEGEGGDYVVTPPSWRRDVTTPACIVEELLRLHGYDGIPPVPVTRTEAVGTGVLSPEQRRRSQVRRALAGEGLAEAVTWSFTGIEEAQRFGAAEPVKLRNPISSELAAMRPSLLPNLLAATARNIAHRRTDGALFELGARFTGAMPGEQVWAVAGLRHGQAGPRHWAEKARPVDAFDAKADALVALEAAGVRIEAAKTAAEAPSWYHPGRSGTLQLGPVKLATFGELHPEVLRHFDVAGPVVAFEIDLDALPKPRSRNGRTRPPLETWPYPGIERDFAFVLPKAVPAEDLLKVIRGAEKKLLRDAAVFDLYEGANMAEGEKSLAVSVRLQSRDRTLKEADAEPVVQRIVAAAEKQLGARLRA